MHINNSLFVCSATIGGTFWGYGTEGFLAGGGVCSFSYADMDPLLIMVLSTLIIWLA